VEKQTLLGKKTKKEESDFFEIGFFEDGTNIEHRASSIERAAQGGGNKRRRLLYICRDDKLNKLPSMDRNPVLLKLP